MTPGIHQSSEGLRNAPAPTPCVAHFARDGGVHGRSPEAGAGRFHRIPPGSVAVTGCPQRLRTRMDPLEVFSSMFGPPLPISPSR